MAAGYFWRDVSGDKNDLTCCRDNFAAPKIGSFKETLFCFILCLWSKHDLFLTWSENKKCKAQTYTWFAETYIASLVTGLHNRSCALFPNSGRDFACFSKSDNFSSTSDWIFTLTNVFWFSNLPKEIKRKAVLRVFLWICRWKVAGFWTGQEASLTSEPDDAEPDGRVIPKQPSSLWRVLLNIWVLARRCFPVWTSVSRLKPNALKMI